MNLSSKQEVPNKLYKYIPPERIDVIRNNKIRFSPPLALNDPFDLKPVFGDVISDQSLDDYVHGGELINTVKQQFRKDMDSGRMPNIPDHKLNMFWDRYEGELIQQFSTMFSPIISNVRRQMAEVSTDKVREYFEGLGVLSLSSIPNQQTMWSHYASNYKGFVIEFDANNAFFKNRPNIKKDFFKLMKVRYLDRNDLKNIIISESTAEDVYASKEKQWFYEEEWRMVTSLDYADEVFDNGEEDIHLFRFPHDAVTGIILGHKISEVTKNQIINIINETYYSHVYLYKTELDLNNMRINIKKL